MLYYSNGARMIARKKIAEINMKIANMPLNAFPGGLGDIQTIHHLLDIMDGELRREMREMEEEK